MTITVTRFEAISSLVGGHCSGTEDGSTMHYHNDQTPPSDAAIDAEIIRMGEEHEAQAWVRNRQKEYPTMEELTVSLFDTDDKAALETKRAATKTKWPKDNSGPVE